MLAGVEVENVTAKEALSAGLVEAIERRQVCLQGTYRVEYDGRILFKQKAVTFKQSDGAVRSLRFDDSVEFEKFLTAFTKYKKAQKDK